MTLTLASLGDPVATDTVRLTYIDHSTFLLQTAGGLSVATDYTGFLGVTGFLPTVVIMNHAHSSHYTNFPDPDIPYALKGWGEAGKPADHYLDLGEMLVRNVTTDIRSRSGFGVEEDGNSIFIFEVAGLCIGHLGHLHHEPDAAQYAALGRLDVVMAAIDGGMTVDFPTMIRIVGRLRASIIIPMHWFGRGSLELFLAGLPEGFAVQRREESTLDVSLRSLPRRPTVLVLEPAFLRDDEF